jgi:3'-5' exoribonuclease
LTNSKAGFSENQSFDRTFLLKKIQEYKTRQGKPYLALVLGTSEGEIEARVWDMGMSSLPGLDAGDPVRAIGNTTSYQDRIQLNVDRLEKVNSGVDPRDLYPSSSFSEADLRSAFATRAAQVKDPDISRLFAVINEDTAFMDHFFISPAAVTMHHARIGGLAEHSVDVCDLALAIADLQPWLSRDLLIAGSLLHDIGKTREYSIGGDFRYSLEGRLIGHIPLGLEMVRGWMRKIPGFPEDTALNIGHLILGHHGQKEYGSPVEPATPEALVVHYADDLDAKLDMLKSASADADGGEAYVRGLRRMFVFGDRGEDPNSSPGTDEGAVVENEAVPAGKDPDDQGKLF